MGKKGIQLNFSDIEKPLKPDGFNGYKWLRREDLNLWPSGYEPDELPTAPLRDVYELVTKTGAGNRGRTGTGITTHGILSPGRLPIPPSRRNRKEKMAPRVGLEPTAYRLTAECSTIELPWNAFYRSPADRT